MQDAVKNTKFKQRRCNNGQSESATSGFVAKLERQEFSQTKTKCWKDEQREGRSLPEMKPAGRLQSGDATQVVT